MGSTFGTYSIAYSGMYVNQASLAATSTNLANVSTTGASQVRVNSATLDTVHSDGTSTGSGVSVASITRARDIYLDSTYRTQNADATYLSVKSGDLEYMDKLLSEYDSVTISDNVTTSTSGVEDAIEDFFDAWETLSTSAEENIDSNRKAVTTAGTKLVNMLTSIDEELQQLQTDAVIGVKDGVDKLNDLSGQVADLNEQITKAEAGGGEASYLRDQRDVLLDQMSSLADISVTESNGTLKVTLNGAPLVNGDTTHELVVEGTGTTDDPLTVKWADSDNKVKITSGSIKAYMEEADQTGYEAIKSSDIPYTFSTDAASSISTMRQGLNDLVTTLAIKMNSLSTSGYDLDGNAGLDFFTAIDSDQPLSITNIQVNPILVADSDKVVASSSSSANDNAITKKVCALDSDTCYQSSGSSLDIIDFYRAVTTWLGTAGDTAASEYEDQTTLVEQVDNQRKAVSAISTDEEMSNMIKFQNAYAASARVMSTIDNLIGDLIDAI